MVARYEARTNNLGIDNLISKHVEEYKYMGGVLDKKNGRVREEICTRFFAANKVYHSLQ